MSDPIGLIGAGGAGGIQPRPAQPTHNPGGANFKDVLMANLQEVNKLQADATEAIEDLASGRRDDIEGVVLATQKADTAFRMLQAVRNKVIQAYEEIKQTRV